MHDTVWKTFFLRVQQRKLDTIHGLPKELRALRGLFGLSMKLKYKKLFFTNLFLCVYYNNNQIVKVSNYFDFYRCFDNKKVTKIG